MGHPDGRVDTLAARRSSADDAGRRAGPSRSVRTRRSSRARPPSGSSRRRPRRSRQTGRFSVALSGGSTPGALFAMLAVRRVSRRACSGRDVHLFWGDERCVPPDDEREQLREWLAHCCSTHVPVRAANVHRIRGEDDSGERRRTVRARVARRVRYADRPAARGTRQRDSTWCSWASAPTVTPRRSFPTCKPCGNGRRWADGRAHRDAAPMWRITLTPPILNQAARGALPGVGPGEGGGPAARAVRRARRGRTSRAGDRAGVAAACAGWWMPRQRRSFPSA